MGRRSDIGHPDSRDTIRASSPSSRLYPPRRYDRRCGRAPRLGVGVGHVPNVAVGPATAHVGGELPAREHQHGPGAGVVDIAGPERHSGTQDQQREPGSAQLQRHLLGPVLGNEVVDTNLVRGAPPPLVHCQGFPGTAKSPRRGDEHGAPDAGTERRSEHVLCPAFVHREEIVAVSGAEPGHGGGVDHGLAASDGAVHRGRGSDVADDPLPRDVPDIVQAAPGANQQPERVPAGRELARHPRIRRTRFHQ